MLTWLGFAVCTLLIVYSGAKLSKYGDIIAEKTGLSSGWIGVVLMASVTSLPELITGISSVTVAGTPDIAVGDAIGSCMFNMLILAGLDALHTPGPIYSRAHHGNIVSAGMANILIAIFVMGMLFGGSIPALGHVGLYTPVLIVVYMVAMRMVYQYEKNKIAAYVKEAAIELKYGDMPVSVAVKGYVLNAAFVVLAALFLPVLGERIAEQTGLGQSFVGSVFVAMSTSLPEVVVSVSAVKMGAVDLAIGNLFGSNMFNLFIVAIDDVLYTKGPLLSSVSHMHTGAAVTAIIMSCIAIVGLTYRAERKRLLMAWDSVVIVAAYLINTVLMYRGR